MITKHLSDVSQKKAPSGQACKVTLQVLDTETSIREMEGKGNENMLHETSHIVAGVLEVDEW